MTNPFKMALDFAAERAMNRLRRRRWQAYKDLFMPGGTLQPAADIVLADMRDFCRARETTFDPDPRMHALLEGRREMWLRVSNALNLDEAAMAALDLQQRDFLEESDDG